jgi:hypothetical protein
MFTAIRRWSRLRRFYALTRQLKSLPARELMALGISPASIDRLAFAATYA